MFAYRGRDYKGHSMRVWPIVLLLALAAFAFAGCGDGDDEPTDLEVIEDWSRTLSEGDVESAAGYFAIPSSAENGPVAVEITSEEEAIAFNEALPCGAEVISSKTEGEKTIAEFRLTERPGGGCGDGVGGTASTAFVIEAGKIVDWERVVGEEEPLAPPAPEAEI